MLRNDEMASYEHTLRAIYVGSSAKDELSLTRWCDRTRQIAQAVRVLQDDLQARYDAKKARYSDAENSKRMRELQTERRTFEDTARAMVQRDLNAVLDAKRAAFSKAMSAPDADSLRLLQVLQMRQNVTAAEIAATVEHLSGNLQSLSVLAEIARKNNVAFPKLITDFPSTEQEVRDAAGQLLNNLFSDDPEYFTRLFLADSGSNGRLQPYVDAMDGPAYLGCDVGQIVDIPVSEEKENTGAAGGDGDASSESV